MRNGRNMHTGDSFTMTKNTILLNLCSNRTVSPKTDSAEEYFNSETYKVCVVSQKTLKLYEICVK